MNGYCYFEIKRAVNCIKSGRELKDYFVPMYREIKLRSKEHDLVGVIDRVDRLFTDKVGVFDYKSSDPLKKKKLELTDAQKEELAIYQILYEENFPNDEVDLLGILWTHVRDSIRKFKPEEKYKIKILQTADIVRGAIENSIFPLTDNTFYCHGCDVKNGCSRKNI